MRPTAVIALWASTGLAFFPYMPAWREECQENGCIESSPTETGKDGSGLKLDIKQRGAQTSNLSPKQLSREIARLSGRYGKKRGDDASLQLRNKNNYNIMTADEPDSDLAAGIDQDGTDYSYFVEAELGSSAKKLYMLIDSGAGSSWVMGSNCSTKACTLHNSFGSDDSTTLEEKNEDFSVSYGSGKVSGKVVTDTISVGGMTLDYEFGVASETSDDFVNFAFDGILGLAANGDEENFLSALKDAGKIQSAVFGVSLHRAADGKNDGEIQFGSPDKARYKGELTYTPIVKDKTDWVIQIDDMGFDGKKAGVGGVPAYIDTGTTFMFGPKDAVKKVHDTIPGTQSTDGVGYQVPCDTNTPLTFTFSGVDYSVSTKDWISPPNKEGKCTSNVYGQEVVQGSWLLGAAFIKNVYVLFDAEQKRIGMAQQSDGSSSTLSTDASKTTTSPTDTDDPKSTTVAAPDNTGDGSDSTETAVPDSAQSGAPENLATSLHIGNSLTFAICIITFFTLLL